MCSPAPGDWHRELEWWGFLCLLGHSGFLSFLPEEQQELTDVEGWKMGGEFLNIPEGASLSLQKQYKLEECPHGLGCCGPWACEARALGH